MVRKTNMALKPRARRRPTANHGGERRSSARGSQKPGQVQRKKPAKASASILARGEGPYVLRLYVTGVTPRSTRAILNIKEICETHLQGHYELEIIDVYQQPVLAKGEQIIAAPTLIKYLPLPLRRFIGDMSRTDKILLGLDLRPAQACA